jgi:hypothetical protein
MHKSTFEYLKPTEDQLKEMERFREQCSGFGFILESYLPDGPDKTYAIRKFREVAMWGNIAITRNADGSPRT